MAKNQSSRQKMINLMYLVFIAMMALNVSTEVLDGFDLVNDNLNKSVSQSIERNEQLHRELVAYYSDNPVKAKAEYDKGQILKQKSDTLYNYLQNLKLEIARKTDGAEANVNNLDNRENIDASSEVMLSPIEGRGKGYELKGALDKYKEDVVALISDTSKQNMVANSLTTEPTERARKDRKNWVTASFDRMPSVAVLSYLTGLQASVKQAEGEALASMLKDVDYKDMRVNKMGAFVIPATNFVVAGAPYQAQIKLAAIDTTQQPRIFVEGKELPLDKEGIFSLPTSTPGERAFKGYIEVLRRDGAKEKYHFTQQYTVTQPMATIAATRTNIVYAGIDNPISISVPGVLSKDVIARPIGGKLDRKSESEWIATTTKIDSKFVVEVYAKSITGGERYVAKQEFRVRRLPDATPFIEYLDSKGVKKQFKRGPIARSILLNSKGIKAAIDDGILDIPFKVLRFKTLFVDAMGNAMPEVSDGANFSQKQMSQIQRLGRGKYFFISGIIAVGPDGVQQELGSMEVRLN